MTFIWPVMLFSLLLVPLAVWQYRRLLQKQQQMRAELGTMGIVQSQRGGVLGRRRHLPMVLFLAAFSLLLFGLARPEMTVALPRVAGTVILAFDVSNSMLADDLAPTRMEAAKTTARAFVENQPSTVMIGVVAFSNGGVVVQPPTNAQADILATIDRLSPEGGTSLGQGIFNALNAVAGEPIAVETAVFDTDEIDMSAIDIGNYPSAIIVMLTDGENTGSPDPLEIAQLAAEAGVRIFPIGIGSEEGAILELDGFNVVTRLNEPTLQQIASLTNGDYYRAEDVDTLQTIYESIDLELTVDGERMEITPIIAGVAMVLLLIGGALSMILFGRVP